MRNFVAEKVPRRIIYGILERNENFPAQRANAQFLSYHLGIYHLGSLFTIQIC